MYEGKKVILRAIEKTDNKLFHKGFNDYETQRFLNPRALLPYSMEEEEKFINEVNQNKDKKIAFSIVTKKEKKLIGSCSCEVVDSKNRNGLIGIAIVDKKYWSKGFGSDALCVLLNILFNEINLRKVGLHVFSYNERAINCYKKTGFKQEGCLKEQLYREGKYHDIYIMSIFKRDFYKSKE